MKLASKFAGIATALMMVSAPASSTVTTWDYSVTSLFTFATYTGAGSGATSSPSLSWGTSTGSGQSSLVVGNSPAIGQVDTYVGGIPPQAPPFLGLSTSLTHNNNPITGNSLLSATLTNTVLLDPFVPDNPPLASFEFVFNISFTETPNSGTCAVAGSPTPCNDIFVLEGGLLNSSFIYDDLTGTGPMTYFVNIFPTTGGVLSILENSACAAAGVANGCIGFSTPENQSTTLAFGFTISTAPLQVPEPGMLALLGLGILGLFAWRRRQD